MTGRLVRKWGAEKVLLFLWEVGGVSSILCADSSDLV